MCETGCMLNGGGGPLNKSSICRAFVDVNQHERRRKTQPSVRSQPVRVAREKDITTQRQRLERHCKKVTELLNLVCQALVALAAFSDGLRN